MAKPDRPRRHRVWVILSGEMRWGLWRARSVFRSQLARLLREELDESMMDGDGNRWR